MSTSLEEVHIKTVDPVEAPIQPEFSCLGCCWYMIKYTALCLWITLVICTIIALIMGPLIAAQVMIQQLSKQVYWIMTL